MAREGEAGVVLVNVLVVLAIGAGVVSLMLAAQERALRSAAVAAGAAQAEALALGAESSVRLALLRDMAEAPQEDHMGEAWALAAQEPVVLATGRFEVTVRDARGRFDVNRLVDGGRGDVALLGRLAFALGLPEETAGRIAARMAREGPLDDISGLGDAGLPGEVLARLLPHLDAHPVPGRINLNAATPELMAALLQNASASRRLLARREASGRLVSEDLEAVRVLVPAGAGFTSDLFEMRAGAEADGASITLVSRLLRSGREETARVVVESRRVEAGSGEGF